MTKAPEPVHQLMALGLRSPGDALQALLTQLHAKRATPTQTLEALCDLERTSRESINLHRRTRSATLGSFKALDQFDWNHPAQLDRALYDQLRGLQFVRDGHNVLFRGAAGVGKTTLAKNLCHLALLKGFKVRFTSLTDMLADLLRQESVPAFERRLRRYVQPQLLVIDELGYLPTDAKAADTLYQVICKRHETRSTIITTNLPYRDWGQVFPSATSVNALVDRFAQNCHVMDIEAESWRHKNGEKFRAAAKTRKKTKS